MNYENNIHIPQQVELLLQHRANGDIDGFNHVLEAIKIIMKDEQTFITGLVADNNKKEKQIIDTAKDCKKLILKAFETGSELEGCQTVQGILSQLENAYNTIMIEYMDDVTQTIMSYHDRGTIE